MGEPKASFRDLAAVAIVLLGIGIGLVLFGGYQVWIAERQDTWPSTNGVVNRSEYRESRRGTETTTKNYSVTVFFEYELNGKTRSDSYRFTFTNNQHQAQAVHESCRKGTEIKVFYDPENPSETTLEPYQSFQGQTGVFLGVTLLASSLLVYIFARRA